MPSDNNTITTMVPLTPEEIAILRRALSVLVEALEEHADIGEDLYPYETVRRLGDEVRRCRDLETAARRWGKRLR